MTRGLTRLIAALSLLTAVTLTSGCRYLGYTLGSTLPPDLRSVYVPTFMNKSKEPEIEIRATSAVIQELKKDGSLRVVDQTSADSVLEVTIQKYQLIPLAYNSDNAKSAEEMRLMITARVVLRRMIDKKVISDSVVKGETTFLQSGDLASAKITALPDAAKDLAHDIVESIVEYWP